ncbi:MAG: glycosyltransferase family 2 protein [Flavobacteriaceae bacterium]|nr:glycosyltransferase family 2 protein [Flavobacteriaceae bacterium]
MKLAIVILNWNGVKLLKEYLPKVISYSPDAEIIVVDNDSTDGSVDMIRSEYPNVRLVLHSTNEGFAKGYNLGLQQVDADLYCLLNSDVEVTEGWLPPILQFFDEHPEAAILQPKILDLKNPGYFEYAGAGGGFLDALGYPFCRGRIFQSIEEDKGQYDDNREIFWATGACMFIRKEVFHSLGGFDEDYFAHQEEIDLCWRARNLGHKVFYVGESHVLHLGGSTLSNMDPRKTYLNFRNSLFSITKNLPKRRAFILILFRLLLDFIAGIRFVLQFKVAHCIAIVHAHISYYVRLRRMLRKRNNTQYLKKYHVIKSIVWAHYVLGIKEFNILVKD